MEWLKKAGKKILRGLVSVIPMVGDDRSEWIRKIAFLLALTVFLCSGYYLVDEVWLQPRYTQEVTHSLRDLYTKGEESNPGTNEDELPVVFPEGMDSAFEPLYRRNQDVAAWLTFAADAAGTAEDLFGGAIDNPVVQAEDNDYYLYRDFLGEEDKAGTLFLDYRNKLTNLKDERNVIIYGHNLNSKLMFSKFNWLVSGNVDRARMLTTLTLDTLYGEHYTYKVFAVMVLDADATGNGVFDYIRTDFRNDAAFETFVEKIRARSLYDFGDVDVLANDHIITLSTCSNKRDTTLKNGRTVVVARRVRDDEEATVDVSKTVLNEDVLMPKAWYSNKGLAFPEEYQ